MTSSDIIRLLDLKPHPEGGHYRETLRDPMTYGDRSVSTAIYFLLAAGEISHWHRVDSIEVWHWYAGAPLALSVLPKVERSSTCVSAWIWLRANARKLSFPPGRGNRREALDHGRWWAVRWRQGFSSITSNWRQTDGYRSS